LAAYLAALPPITTPALGVSPLCPQCPDEIAIVVYETPEAYEVAKSTPAGSAYTRSHWQYFNINKTQSQGPVPLNMTLESEVPVDLMQLPLNWQTGHSVVIVGQRLPSIPESEFLQAYTNHVVLVRGALQPLGLDGFVVVANTNVTIAWLHWPTQQQYLHTLTTPEGRAAGAAAGFVITTVMWQDAVTFTGNITYGQGVNVLFTPRTPPYAGPPAPVSCSSNSDVGAKWIAVYIAIAVVGLLGIGALIVCWKRSTTKHFAPTEHATGDRLLE